MSMVTDFKPGMYDDVGVAPELAGLDLEEKPDGPAAAAMIAAGIGVLFLGIFTTGAVISSSLKSFLLWWEWGQGVGPLAGKTTLATIIWLGSWLVLWLLWRHKDVVLKTAFYIGLGMGLVGVLFTFPLFFDIFHT
jgi:hypothetical protein